MKHSAHAVFWKVFFFVWLAYTGTYVYLAIVDRGAGAIGDMVVAGLLLVNAVALFGLAYHKRIAWLLSWRIYFGILIAILIVPWVVVGVDAIRLGSSAVSEIVADQSGFFPVLFPVLAAILAIGVYGLYRYAFRSPELWGAKAPRKRR